MTAPDPQPTLAAFLLARLAEDEAESRDHDLRPHAGTCSMVGGDTSGCDCDYPARVLADVAAKKKIAAEHMQRPDGGCYDCETSLCRFQLFLAQPYADHSDFRAEWAP